MTEVSSLELQKLTTLFDYTYNSYAKAVVADMMCKPLASEAAIKERQQAIRGLLHNPEWLKSYSYNRGDMEEIYPFCSRTLLAEDFRLPQAVNLTTQSKSRAQAIHAHTQQLILLFHRLLSRFYLTVKIDYFSAALKASLDIIVTFLSRLDLYGVESLIREQKIKQSDTNKFIRLFLSKGDVSIQKFWSQLFYFEAHVSIATGTLLHKFALPDVANDCTLTIEGLYHPLLSHPVVNSMQSAQSIALLTGPNMAGKSTLLKAMAICVYFAHLGVGIPAAKAAMPFYNNIFVWINTQDDLQKGYSHFKAELVNLKDVCEGAITGRTFAVFDELFRGTNHEDALALLKRTIIGLARYPSSTFILSTHATELEAWQTTGHISLDAYKMECEADNESISFSYRLSRGWSSVTLGQTLFDAEGLKDLLS